MKYQTRVTRLTVLPAGEPIFSEMATHVEIEDEAAGEFVVVSQHRDSQIKGVSIEPNEWPAIRAAIESLLGLEEKP